MIRIHRNAVIASLETLLPGAVFTSYGAHDIDRYTVVFFAKTRKEAPRYTGKQTREVYTATIHSVGSTEESCLWVQERVDTLTDQVLVVPGRSLWPIEYVTGTEPSSDDDGPFPLWWTTTQFDITSDPA